MTRLALFIRRHARGVSLLVALAVVVAGTESALALTSSTPSETARPGAAQLGVLSRPATVADRLPSNLAGQLTSAYTADQPLVSGSREVSTNTGQKDYLVPTQSGGICFIGSNEELCAPAAHSAGASAVDLCSPALPLGEMEIEWLIPDRASSVSLTMSNGTADNYAPGSNLYIARLPLNPQSPTPSTIDWTANGRQYSVRAPIPADAATARCAHPPASATSPAVPRERRNHQRATIVIDRPERRREHAMVVAGRSAG